MSRKEMSKSFGIPLRTLESWDAGDRKPPQWAERLLKNELERMFDEKMRGGRIGMNSYAVGQVINLFRGHPECLQFDIADSGATMLAFFNRPSQWEVQQFSSDNPLEFRLTEIYGVIILTVKVGELNWMDAPFTPHLSRNLTKLIQPEDNQGLLCNIILVDSSTGVIRHIRSVGFSNSFTKKLFALTEKQMNEGFDRQKYYDAIKTIYKAYSSDEIAKMGKTYCKFN